MAALQLSKFSKVFQSMLPISPLSCSFEPPKGFGGYTIYSGYWLPDEIMDVFACSLLDRIVEMPDVGCSGRFDGQDDQPEPGMQGLTSEQDLLMEQILENINTTPIGRLLKRLSSLPEVRKDKVLHIRRQLTHGKYQLNERLDIVLEKVLNDLNT